MSRLSRAVVSSALGLALSAPLAAQAQETSGLGTERPIVVSLEHIGGVVATRFEADGADEADSTVNAGTFIGPLLGQTPVARLGLHYFVAPPISLGALLSYSDNDSLGDNLLLGARVGALLPMGPSTDIWLRGGVHYVRSEFELFGKTTITDVRPGAEALLAFSPLENFGFLLGGMFEIGVAGKIEAESPIGNQKIENDFSYMEYGLTFGVFADF